MTRIDKGLIHFVFWGSWGLLAIAVITKDLFWIALAMCGFVLCVLHYWRMK